MLKSIFLFMVSCCVIGISAAAVTPEVAPEVAPTGVTWFTKTYGQMQPWPAPLGEGLMTLSCGQSLETYSADQIPMNHVLVGANGQKGLLRQEDTSEKRPSCPQGKYPRFMNGLELTLMDLYYWGRLNDIVVRGRSKAK
jgi:hypothetical protein